MTKLQSDGENSADGGTKEDGGRVRVSQDQTFQCDVWKMTATVRGVGAILVALAACGFVYAYSDASHFLFRLAHPHGSLDHECSFILRYSRLACLVPIAAVAPGALAIWRRRQALFEILLVSVVILSFLWLIYCVLMWRVQEVPRVSLRGLHW